MAGSRAAGLRERATTRPVHGCFVGLAVPTAVECLALAGFDFACLDNEHVGMDPTTVELLVLTAHAVDLPLVVRTPLGAPNLESVLDMGADGVLVPHVSHPDEAAGLAARARHPEAGGTRGTGLVRANHFGADFERGRDPADAPLLLVQLEERMAVERAAEIAATPGIDGVLCGPGDLALSERAQADPRPVAELVEKALVAVADTASLRGTYCPPADLPRWVALGANLTILGSDVALLREAAVDLRAAVEP